MKPIGAFLFVLGVLASTSVVSQTPFQRLDVVSGDFSGFPAQTATNGPEFGFSVAIDGEWMAVGAPGTIANGGEPGFRRGTVFMFRNQGDEWEYTQRLVTSISLSVGPDARCGHSVALSGSFLVVGCPGVGTQDTPNSENGRTIFFRRNADQVWEFGPGFTGLIGMRCGTSVDIASNPLSQTAPVLAVTGCPGWDSGRGQAIVYHYDGSQWQIGPAYAASDGANGDSFGSAVALTVTCESNPNPPFPFFCTPRLAVGAPNKAHGSAILGGAVYVYAGNNFNQTDIFTHFNPGSFGATRFGTSVAMNFSQLLIGSPGAFTTNCGVAPRCGRTIRRERSGSSWSSTDGGGAVNLGGMPPGEQVGMQFGRSVALGFDNWIAIGAPLTNGGGSTLGGSEGLGMVELRRNSNGNWGNSWGDSRGELRPESFSISLDYEDSQFGASVAFGDERWLAVGVPRWPEIRFPGPTQVRRGQVWMYAEPDGLFNDRFEQ